MSTKNIAIAVGAVVVLGALWYFMGGSMMSSSTPSNQDGSAMEEGGTSADGTFTGSLSDLAKRGGNYQCTFTQETAEAKASGTVYVSGYDIRGDFTSSVEDVGMTVENHMLQTGGYTYVWSSAAPMGFKTKVTQTDTGSGYAPMSGEEFSPDQSYAYKCAPWTVDSSKFVVPTDIQFVGS